MDVTVDYKASWAPKNWCFWTVVLEKTCESPLDSKEIQPVHPKGNQSWIFTGKTEAEAKTPILWPPDVKNWLIWKDPDAGKDWRQAEQGMTENEMIGGHHQLYGYEFEQAPGVCDGQGSLACCNPWGSQTVRHDQATELNWKSVALSWSLNRSLVHKWLYNITHWKYAKDQFTKLCLSFQCSHISLYNIKKIHH